MADATKGATDQTGEVAELVAVAEELWWVMRHAPDCGRGCTCHYEPLAERMRALLAFRMAHGSRTSRLVPARRTAQEAEAKTKENAKNLVRRANDLAWEFSDLLGFSVPVGHRFDLSDIPCEEQAWELACTAIESFGGGDAQDAAESLGEVG